MRISLDWREQLKLLKLRYPTRVAASSATYEVPYGATATTLLRQLTARFAQAATATNLVTGAAALVCWIAGIRLRRGVNEFFSY